MGRGEKKGERFLLIAYYVQATVPGVVSWAPRTKRACDPRWLLHREVSHRGHLISAPQPSHLLKGGTQILFFAGKLRKVERTRQHISKALENPEYTKKISAFEFLLR